jgi:antitoxin component YwqK of YwqJK toxin-antitoxin module
MSENEVLQKNLKRWSLFYPLHATILEQVRGDHAKVVLNKNGTKNLAIHEAGKEPVLYHSEDPYRQATEWFQSLDLAYTHVLFVYGVGLGYYYDPLAEWLRKDKGRYVVFLEDNLEVIRKLFETEQGSKILHDEQVWLAWLDPKDTTIDALSQTFVLKPFQAAPVDLYKTSRPDDVMKVTSKLSFYMNLRAGNTIEYSHHGAGFFNNFVQNLFTLPKSHFGNNLFGKFKGVPAIICGAGPSIKKNAHVLKQLRDRAIIFAGGTGMNAINAYGVVPHFGVGIDPNKAQATRIIMNTAFETPFFYRNRLNHEALDLVHGEHLFLTGSIGYDISEWFEKKLSMKSQTISEGCNVLNFSLAIAHAMGCTPIILVGIDLAYTNSQSYAEGVTSHPLHNRKDHFGTKTPQEELLVKNDIYGQPTFTLWKWVSEAMWYANFAKLHPQVQIINSTEGGLGFQGIPNIPLQELADNFFKSQYDLDAFIQGEIENAVFPSTVSPEIIERALQDITESLQRCIGFCITLQTDFEESFRNLHAGKESSGDLLSEPGLKALEAMEKEPAWTHILKVFNDIYLQIISRDLQRLDFDKEILSLQQINQKKTALAASRYNFLKDTAKVNAELIQKIMKNWKEKNLQLLMRAQVKKTTAPQFAVEELASNGYSLEEGRLSIVDPQMGISFEDLSKEITKDVIFYPGGQIKLESYKKNQLLHGPSTFFSEQGKMLVRHWYFNGKREGKGWRWYSTGPLHSLVKYKNGELDGKQWFFYPDGTLKSLLSYKNGVLDGEVLLYYRNGQLKRSLSFVDGRRHGFERIWNEQGLLVVEAEFDADKPKGTARKWRENGNIALEVIYQTPKEFMIREWDDKGVPSMREERMQEDYFDKVTRQIGVFTHSLDNIVEQVDKVAPLISQALEPNNPAVEKPFAKDLEELKNELKHLHELSKAMAAETGLDVQNIEEEIWKTPSNSRELEKQVESMTTEMSAGMGHIQEALAKTIGLLVKKINPNKDK